MRRAVTSACHVHERPCNGLATRVQVTTFVVTRVQGDCVRGVFRHVAARATPHTRQPSTAQEMFRASFLHVGGSMAINEVAAGTNLSSGLVPANRTIEATLAAASELEPVGHKTGEACGSVFWVSSTNDTTTTSPTTSDMCPRSERSLLNVGIASSPAWRAGRVGSRRPSPFCSKWRGYEPLIRNLLEPLYSRSTLI